VKSRIASSLFTRLSLVLLGLSLVVGALTVALTIVTGHVHQLEVQQRMHRDLAAHVVAENLLIADGRVDEANLEHVFHVMMLINPSIEVYLLDPRGEILAYSAPPGRVKLARVSLEPVAAFLEAPDRYPVHGDNPRHPDDPTIFSAAPVLRDGRIEGYLYIVLASEAFGSVVELLRGSWILRTGAVAVAGSGLLVLLAGVAIFRRLTRRVTDLSHEMRAWESERLGPRSTPEELPMGADEIESLRGSFQRMASRIDEQMDELERQDRLRREMVANVSHDLRTPLSHLQGYLETLLLKSPSMSNGERHSFLELALRHTQRLGRLIADLFELATLENLAQPLHREPLVLAELVQDVAQKFRHSATERGIRIDAVLDAQRSWMSADVGLIERAVGNVVDNALRHTPRGGHVRLALSDADLMLRLDISDTGPGIPAEHLPHLFERFYRAGRAAGDDASAGAGLGLAIAKRAAELHGGDLSCRSFPGEGTTFRFELPAAS
jgi:signal transduction histidine kinase